MTKALNCFQMSQRAASEQWNVNLTTSPWERAREAGRKSRAGIAWTFLAVGGRACLALPAGMQLLLGSGT